MIVRVVSRVAEIAFFFAAALVLILGVIHVH